MKRKPLRSLSYNSTPRTARPYIMLKLLALGAVFIGGGLCFKSGAPTSMCASMEPKHKGAVAEKTKSPYEILLDASEGNEGIVKVSVKGSIPFKGILLEGRRGNTGKEGSIVGQFIKMPETLKTLTCDTMEDSAVTHSSGEDKESIEVTWQAPADFNDDVTFIATVVSSYSSFWTNVLANPVRVTRGVVPTKKANTIPDSLYNGCSSTKNCVGSPPGCIAKKDCIALVAVSKTRSGFQFEMMALGSKYIAAGLSEDDKMGGDSVVECAYENHKVEFEGVYAYRSWNVPNMKKNDRLDKSVGLELLDGSYEDGNVKCKVSLELVTKVGEVTFDLSQTPYNLLLAAGKTTAEGKIGYHDVAREASIDTRLLSDLSPPVINDSFYNGCNSEKNCFGHPDGCVQTQSCQAVASILAQGVKYRFQLKSKGAAYVAAGLSTDNKMGGDSVMECVNEGGNVKLYMSWNKPNDKANTRAGVNQDAVTLTNSSYSDGVIFCEFTREASTRVMNQTFDLANDKYFLLLAAGASLKDASVGYHDLLFTSTSQQRALADVGAFTSQSKLFIRLHGAFMVAAWIGTASIGIVFARYFKQTWVESSLCSKDLWFAWHRTFMLITWALTVVACVLIFVEVGGWVGQPSYIHAILGCITVFLCFIQPFIAAVRPHPTARNRPAFNWIHWFIGNAAHICAVVTIFFAIPLSKAELPDWMDYILVAFVALYVLVHLLLTIGSCISEQKGSKRVNSFPMKDVNTSRSALNGVERKMDAPLTGFRKFILFIHVIGITAITAALIVIITLAPIEAQWTSFQNKIM